jgi:hypothetical protein
MPQVYIDWKVEMTNNTNWADERTPNGSSDLTDVSKSWTGAGHLPWFDSPGHVSQLLRDHFGSATG